MVFAVTSTQNNSGFNKSFKYIKINNYLFIFLKIELNIYSFSSPCSSSGFSLFSPSSLFSSSPGSLGGIVGSG